MATVVGIRFKDSGKTYFFDPRELELQVGESVIVDTARGPELAKVAYARHEVPESEVVGELKVVLRPADQADFDRMRLLHLRHDEVLGRCGEKIAQHGLQMKLVKAEYSFDGSRLTFFFTSEKRVDFRMLVRDLARTFKSRIELRQIGPRDEAKLLGGIGPCGRLLCCATFLPDYARVSIKMAKDQDLPLNPTKISGVCGRLLCCLSYEHEQYLDIKAHMPSRGAWVQTPEGPGEVVGVNVLKESVMVMIPGNEIPSEWTLVQVQTATTQVGEVARSRVEQGVAPIKPERPPRREPRDRGERRLLRDELESGELLEALDLLNEGGDEGVDGDTAKRHTRNDEPEEGKGSGSRPGLRPQPPSQATPPEIRHSRPNPSAPSPSSEERFTQQRGEAQPRAPRPPSPPGEAPRNQQRRPFEPGEQQRSGRFFGPRPHPPRQNQQAGSEHEAASPDELPSSPDGDINQPPRENPGRVRRRHKGRGGREQES